MKREFIRKVINYCNDLKRRAYNAENLNELEDLYFEVEDKYEEIKNNLKSTTVIDSIDLNDIMEYFEYIRDIPSMYVDSNSYHDNSRDSYFNRIGMVMSVEAMNDNNVFKIALSKTNDISGFANIFVSSDNDLAEPGKIEVNMVALSWVNGDINFYYQNMEQKNLYYEINKLQKFDKYPMETSFGNIIFCDDVYETDNVSAFLFNVFYMFFNEIIEKHVLEALGYIATRKLYVLIDN